MKFSTCFQKMVIVPFLACMAAHAVNGGQAKTVSSREASLARADSFIVTRQYEKALEELALLLELSPEDPGVLQQRAKVLFIKRDWQQAAEAYGYLKMVNPGSENMIRYYTSKRELLKGDTLGTALLAREMKEIAGSLLRRQEGREEALSVAYELFSMADTGTLAIKPLKETLLQEFPNSKAGYEIIVNDFYEGIYPIWRNDTARVPYCEAFLETYPETEWRFTVYQYLLSSLHRLERYDELLKTGNRLLREESENPFAYQYLAYLLVEEKREFDRSVKYAKQALALWEDYQKPENLAVAQWELNRKALLGDSYMVLARALFAQKRCDEAALAIQQAIENTDYGVDDYRSKGSYYCMQGMIQKACGHGQDAVHSYLQAMIAGDENNKWTPKADSGIRQLLDGVTDSGDIIEHLRSLSPYRGAVFDDVTEAMGMEGVRASRVAWGDYNGDGFDDLLLNGCHIYENNKGQSFEEVSDVLGIEAYSASGGIWGDWNNDGLLDFFSSSGGKGEQGDRLWRQRQDGGFEDMTAEAGDVTNDMSTEGAAWGDANGDGFLDLYLANYENWKEHSYYPDEFYRCENGRWFEEVSGEVGMVPPFNEERAGRGVNWADFDNDGDLDVFVSNYRLQENFLWRNNGEGTFTNVAHIVGVAGDEVEGWWGHTIGSSWADYDNDGDLDLITANLAHPRYIEFSNMTRLYENQGPPQWRFVDRRKEAGIKYEETHSDPAWADIDSDGDLDLYLTAVYEGRKSFLYENLGDGTFRDITFLAGVRVLNGWGCALSDFDCDGDMDLFVASGSGVHLFENRGNDNNYLKVRVKGKTSNSSGIGARVTVKQGENVQMREVQGGKGTTNQNSFVQYFGFGDNGETVVVEVRFPNGRHVVRRDVSLNQLVEISE